MIAALYACVLLRCVGNHTICCCSLASLQSGSRPSNSCRPSCTANTGWAAKYASSNCLTCPSQLDAVGAVGSATPLAGVAATVAGTSVAGTSGFTAQEIGRAHV